MPRAAEIIDAPFQIIVEGADDCGLYGRLVRDLALTQFQVGCGRGDDQRCLGRDGFGSRLDVIKNATTVPILGYVIIADTDDDPAGRFRDACNHLRNNQVPVPGRAWEIAQENGVKSAVLMVPAFDREGGLETLLLECCNGITRFANCVGDFFDCITHDENPPRRRVDADKLRLRALIAATNVADPGMSLTFWVSSDVRPFAMNHAALSPIADFLRAFTA